MQLLHLADQLSERLLPLRFSKPITHVYNPLVYARAAHGVYIEKFGQASPREVMLLGMNPGPFGMAQTGVPFGEVALVRDWMGVQADVTQPNPAHPKRPVTGFACTRSEVSGARLWGWARELFDTPENFFKRFYVANYCPLVFMEESGRNFTPDKLPAAEQKALFSACDAQLVGIVEHLRPRFVIGVGAFAEARARTALKGMDLKVGRVLHPSPASPLANRGWAETATQELRALGIDI